MEATLQHVLSVGYATLGISVLVLINQVLIFITRDKINGTAGPRSPLPVINYGFRIVRTKLGTWAGKRKKYKTPDIMPQLGQQFARWIVNHNNDMDFREVALEQVMDRFGCPNIKVLRSLLQDFEAQGILTKATSAGNSTRKLASYKRLREKANLLPTTTSSTPKAA
jgi:hypothetical protein